MLIILLAMYVILYISATTEIDKIKFKHALSEAIHLQHTNDITVCVCMYYRS